MMNATPPPNVVTVDLGDQTPLLVAYRDGDGPWQTLDLSQPLELHVHNAYQVLGVCGTPELGFQTEIFGATFETDGATVPLPCRTFSVPKTATVTGTMVQPGTIWISEPTDSLASNWTFELDVPLGEHELVAVAGNKILVRKGVMVSLPSTLATVDLEEDGTEMQSVPLVINGKLPEENLTIDTYLFTGHDSAVLRGQGSTAMVAPPSQVTADDQQLLFASVDSFPTARYIATSYEGKTPGPVALMDPLTGITRFPGGVTWSVLPAGSPELTAYSRGNMVRATATTSYLANSNAMSLIAAGVKGFDVDWAVDIEHPDFMRFAVYDLSENLSRGTTIMWTAGSAARLDPAQHVQRSIANRLTSPLRAR
ncbi:MAG: hypothetical protein AB7P03_19365 [Kofleriaceae bacterium]